MNKLTRRSGFGAAATLLIAASVALLAPAAAHAVPVGCSGPDAPPACNHNPAPPVLLRTPTFHVDQLVEPALTMEVDPALTAPYRTGDSGLVAYLDCANGGAKTSIAMRLELSSDRHYFTLVQQGVAFQLPGDTCSFSTDLSAQLHLSHAQLSTGTTGPYRGFAATGFFN
jgi:hypothetical protein